MGELSDVINEETPTYTFGGLMADIGGAMGLLLGLRKGSTIFFPRECLHFQLAHK